MDVENIERCLKQLASTIIRCANNLDQRDVWPRVSPGFLFDKYSKDVPLKGQQLEEILHDVEKELLPGIICHQHPNFHAYYIQGNSMASLLGDTLASAFAINCVNWNISPTGIEVEAVTLDWVGQMIGLPQDFLFQSRDGGGVIQSSSSECIFYSMLAARDNILDLVQSNDTQNPIHPSRLVAYTSSIAHFAVKKACNLAMVTMREIEPDGNFAMRGSNLLMAIKMDRQNNLIPFYVCATLGTTLCCSFDNLEEIGQVCDSENLWLHVDAAYAGSAFICPEYRHYLAGIESASSFNCNANKLLQVHTDCALMWVRHKARYIKTFSVENGLFENSEPGLEKTNFMNWGVPLSRRFRGLKLWFVLKMYGLEGLQQGIRKHSEMAALMEKYVKNDNRFEIARCATLGLVCFRLKGENELTFKLERNLNATRKLYIQTAVLGGKSCIRFVIMDAQPKPEHVEFAFKLIVDEASRILCSDGI